MLSLDCISFHSCGLTCTLMAHHGCWVSTVSSSLSLPNQSTYSSQLVARESTSSSASFLTQAPGTAPRGHVVSLSQRVFRFPMPHPSLSSTLTKAAPLSLWPLPGHVFLNVIYFQRMGRYLCSVQPPRPPEPVLEGRDLFCFDHRVDSRVPFSRTFAGPAHP